MPDKMPGWSFADTINMVKCPRCHAKVGLDCRKGKATVFPPHTERAEAVIRKFGGPAHAPPMKTFIPGNAEYTFTIKSEMSAEWWQKLKQFLDTVEKEQNEGKYHKVPIFFDKSEGVYDDDE